MTAAADGALVGSTAAGHWAWVGMRLRPVADGGRREPDRRAERAWLAGQWEPANGARWQLRYRGIAGERVSAVLLGRVHGRDRDAVVAAAGQLRARLARTPGQVRAEPLLDQGEIQAALQPPRPHPAGGFELRKRLSWAWCGRPELRRVCFSFSPLEQRELSWEPVWTELSKQDSPTTLTVHLEPFHPSAAFTEGLRRLAVEYATLAGARAPSPIWTFREAVDPFAVEAAPRYAEFAHRYAAKAYRLRVSLMSEGPVEPAFAELVADTVGGAAACRVPAAELDLAWRNLAALNADWLDETYRQGAPPGELDDVERTLSELVDLDEARAAFQLPYEAAAGAVRFEEASTSKPGSGKRVFVSYVREDTEAVDRLVRALRAAGYDVWIDRSNLLPGQRWRQRIRQAIASGDYFLACFSSRWSARSESYMNEELIAAVERLRRMPRDRSWFIPVRLEQCELPDYLIGPGETLADLQCADFWTGWDSAFEKVVATLGLPE